MTTFTIDCDSCPARGRMCGDCFVPVLGQVWLEMPTIPGTRAPAPGAAPVSADPVRSQTEPDPLAGARGALALDSDEIAAVGALVRAGLVHPDEAARARAGATAGYAVG